MKNRFLLLIIALCAFRIAIAQVHISVEDPQTWATQELLPYVGQTVIFDVPMVVTSNYGGLSVSTRRLYNPTNQTLPRSEEYRSLVSLNASGEVSLSGVSGYHRCGEKIYNLKAIVGSDGKSLTWVSGEWQGNTRAELEAGIPDVGDYKLLVCTYNLENFSGDNQKQNKKIINAFTRINADLIGLVEVLSGNNSLAVIANELNQRLPERAYKYCSSNATSGQTVEYIYDSKTVKHLGTVQINNLRTQNRKKMACFEEISSGERFIFSVNHFKAKSGTGTGANADMKDGQGAFNADRKEEAQSVVDEYKDWSRQIDEYDVLIMGDLNALGKEDPITVLTGNGMIDLHRAFHADTSYSYTYRDRQYNYLQLAGYLDHALCNNSMRPQITGMAAYHINSDESDSYTYDKSSDTTMFRGSDHDPVLVGLHLDGSLVYDPSPKINTADLFSGEATTMFLRDAQKDGQHSYYAIYNTRGVLLERQEITSELQEIQPPQTPGMYIFYVYYDGQVYRYKFIVR